MYRDQFGEFVCGYWGLKGLTLDTTIGNQRFRHDRCNIFLGLSYNKANNTFLNSRRKNDVGNEVEFTSKVMERTSVTCY